MLFIHQFGMIYYIIKHHDEGGVIHIIESRFAFDFPLNKFRFFMPRQRESHLK